LELTCKAFDVDSAWLEILYEPFEVQKKIYNLVTFLRDAFVNQACKETGTVTDRKLDDSMTSSIDNGSPGLHRSFEEMINSMAANDFTTEEDIMKAEEALEKGTALLENNNVEEDEVTQSEQLEIIQDLVSAVSKLPLESFAASKSPHHLVTVPPTKLVFSNPNTPSRRTLLEEESEGGRRSANFTEVLSLAQFPKEAIEQQVRD
jgi:hypothetical protein